MQIFYKRMSMLCYVFLIFLYITLLLLTISEQTCLKNITCVSLPTCAPFMKVISNSPKPLKIDLVKFLRSQECDFEQGFPKVCCSHSAFHGSKFDNAEVIKFPTNSEKPIISGNDNIVLPSTPEGEKIRQQKIEQMNKVLIESGILDFIGFDLFRRKKSHYLLYMIDVEIR